MKKPNCLLFILVIACCGVTSAQAPASTQAQAPTPAQIPPAQQVRAHHPTPAFHRWSFNLLGGPAYPVGQFAQTNESNPQSGRVHTGSLFGVSGTYRLNRSWGITLLANHQHHNSEVDQFIVPGGSVIPETSVPGILTSNPGASQPPAPQHWSMTRLLAGGVYTLPLNKRKNLALLLRALAGVQKTHVPQYEYSVKVQNGTGIASSNPRDLAWTLSYQADAGLQYKVYRRWSLLAFAGYNGAFASYKQNITGFFYTGGLAPANPPQVFKRFHFPTGSILVRAGVGFDL